MGVLKEDTRSLDYSSYEAVLGLFPWVYEADLGFLPCV